MNMLNCKVTKEKSPLGIVPEKLYEENRIVALIRALNRYADDGVIGHRVTVVWAEELVKRLKAYNG